MKPVAHYLPSWLLKVLPVRLARQYASSYAQQSIPADSIPLQLLVDVSVVYRSDARTGIQRVVRALLLQLLRAPPAGYCIRPVFATAKRGYCYADPNFLEPLSRVNTIAGTAVEVKNGDLFLGLDLAAHLLPRHRAQVLSWKRSGVKVHVMAYDLLPLQYPEWFNDKTTRNFRRWIKWVAVYADSAICISDTVKTELGAWLVAKFNLPPTALPASTIVLGADISASAPTRGVPPDAEFLLARLRSTPSVLMVGTLEPRKSYGQALAAFDLLWQKQGVAPMLVIVGQAGWKTDRLQAQLRTHPQMGKRLIWLEDASDEFLARLYTNCSGVLVASRAEGFGLPVIEAAMHGKPVLARNIPVFREATIPLVSYFDGDDAPDLATAISSWLVLKPAPYVDDASTTWSTWQHSAKQLANALDLPSLGAIAAPVETTTRNPTRIEKSV
jgi:glycosyltransferase involved in cell wall biosynthesis